MVAESELVKYLSEAHAMEKQALVLLSRGAVRQGPGRRPPRLILHEAITPGEEAPFRSSMSAGLPIERGAINLRGSVL